MSVSAGRLRRTGIALLVLTLVGAGRLLAQTTLSPVEDLDFDRPEAWAMKYFTSLSFLTGLEPPHERRAGSVELGIELGWIPHLSRSERTVGFDGTKEEDLNKLSVFARPRVTVGLPGELSLIVAYVPPVEINGVRPNLVAAALERPLAGGRHWGLGARLAAQKGRLKGDFTCPEQVVGFPVGSPGNPFGCRQRSRDETDLDYVSLELVGSYRLDGPGSPLLHLGVAGNRLDMEFHVNSRTFGIIDRTRLNAEGWTTSFAGGVAWHGGERATFGVDVFYTPLSVRRPTVGESRTESLVNARFVASYRVR